MLNCAASLSLWLCLFFCANLSVPSHYVKYCCPCDAIGEDNAILNEKNVKGGILMLGLKIDLAQGG